MMLGAVHSFLPSLVSQVPNYFTLPLRSSSSHSNPHDPNVKSYPAGMQDNIYGAQTALGGQVALAALFHEALSYQQVRTLYEAGGFIQECNNHTIIGSWRMVSEKNYDNVKYFVYFSLLKI